MIRLKNTGCMRGGRKSLCLCRVARQINDTSLGCCFILVWCVHEMSDAMCHVDIICVSGKCDTCHLGLFFVWVCIV